MHDVPTELLERLRRHKQEHLIAGWRSLDAAQQQRLMNQLEAVDFVEIERLYAQRDDPSAVPGAERLTPVPIESASRVDTATTQLGHDALARGELAVLLVAGGQGTRLGFDKPKGMFPIGPVSNKTLFHIHADKVFALTKKYGRPVPFLVMTSPATHDDTEKYFAEQKFFGLGKDNVRFFKQGTMPAVDIATGKLLLEAPGTLFTSPNGHGGTLTALADSGLLDEMTQRGIRHVFYFQVDNPLVKIGHPAFLGRHIALRSEASSKAINKAFPKEKMGVFALIDGRCGIVEYSDLPDDLAHASVDGQLVYRAGNPAIHLFDIAFLRRVTTGSSRLPFHVARKKVPHIDAAGGQVNPSQENALKFEMFVFDALPMAERFLVMESPRSEEFSPVKNADGLDSPATAKQAMCDLAAEWLKAAGVRVTAPVEISPRLALDAAELHGRVNTGRSIDTPTYLE